MATTPNAVIAAAMVAGGVSNWQTPGYIRGNVRVMVDWYVGTSSDTTGSVISMFPPLDAGSMILFFILGASASTGSLTFSLGDSGSATRYLSAGTGIATAGSNIIPTLEASTGPYIIGTNTGDNQIIITTGGATLGTGTIYSLQCFYTID
jgi:hypothetical protein